MASPVQEGHYIPSPAQERYYDQLAKSLINSKVRSNRTINNDKLNQAITDLKAEAKSGHKLNINDMTQVDEYKSPGENKNALTINNRHIIIRMSMKMKLVIRIKRLRRVKSQSQILTVVTHQLES